jgi:hypothetical protein
VHLGVRFASLLGNHIKGLRQRFVQVETPVKLPSGTFFDADFATRQSPSTTHVPFDVREAQQPVSSLRISADRYVNVPLVDPVEEPTGNIGSGGIHSALFMQDSLPSAGEELSLSGSDWFALPIDASDNTFMQSFFEIGPFDARFFWDTTL